MTRQLSSTYRDLVPSIQIIVTRDFSTVSQDWQKPRYRDADSNSANRWAVSIYDVAVLGDNFIDIAQLIPLRNWLKNI